MIKRLDMTESMHIAMDRIEEERAREDAVTARWLAACLRELGGDIAENWQYDKVGRYFWVNTEYGDRTIATPSSGTATIVPDRGTAAGPQMAR